MNVTVDSELVRLLMRIGYLAAWNGLYKESLVLFDGVRAARPGSEAPIIGTAVVAMLSGNADTAAQVLRDEALKVNPASDFAKAHLGCALRLSGSSEEGNAILRELAASSKDPDARQMALNVLESPL